MQRTALDGDLHTSLAWPRHECQPNGYAFDNNHIGWIFAEGLEVTDHCPPRMRVLNPPLCLAGSATSDLTFRALAKNGEPRHCKPAVLSLMREQRFGLRSKTNLEHDAQSVCMHQLNACHSKISPARPAGISSAARGMAPPNV